MGTRATTRGRPLVPHFMSPTILILTEPGDAHAQAVAAALRLKGAEPILWFTTDFPMLSGESIIFEGGIPIVKTHGPELEFPCDAQVVWHRRPAYVLNQELLHPADRDFADLQCRVFRRSFYNLLFPSSFWVNPHEAARQAGRKPVQHAAALAVGLEMPDTLYSNDPCMIREFIRRHGGQIVYKPLRGRVWRDEETYWMPYTSLIREEDLIQDEILRCTPGIFQELVAKSYELRLTVIGHRIFGAKVLSQATQTGRLDWRKAYSELEMVPAEVPPEIQARCRGLLSRLGLVFGCFDFIVTPDGHHIFLEVNEMGQFLFVEAYTGMPLLDAFCEFLIQGRLDFEWKEDRAAVGYSDLIQQVDEAARKASQEHQVLGDTSIWEGGAAAE